MKSKTFNYSLLAVGVAAVMGLSTGAMAATNSTPISSDAAAINNQATAVYKVANIDQPKVTSNTVTVNISETARFTLIGGVSDTTAGDDKNENVAATPTKSVTFTHILTNEGNVTDTYTILATGNDDNTIDTKVQNYALGTSAINYTIRQKGGTALTTDQISALAAIGQTVTSGTVAGGNALANGSAIQLLPGLEAELSYSASTPTGADGGKFGVGTLQATSTFITGVSSAPATAKTLVNENQTIVKLPVFKIDKTAACQTETTCSNLDLTVAQPKIIYTVKVKNIETLDYSAAAGAFVIRDVLPVGMTLDTSATNSSGVVVVGNMTGGQQVIGIPVASLALGAEVSFTFTVNVDKAKYKGANSSATNHAKIYAKYDGTAPDNTSADTITGDITDSTNDDDDDPEVPADGNGDGAVGKDTTVTVNFTNRNLTLVGTSNLEIAPVTGQTTTATAGQVTHNTTIITNNGQDIEGDTAGELTFTITDSTAGNNIDVVPGSVKITYTPPKADGTPGNAPEPAVTISPTATGGNTYDINSALSAGILKGGTVKIEYNVRSGSGVAANDVAIIGASENTVVTLIPGGINPPANLTVTDKNEVKGLTLLKQAAIDTTCSAATSSLTYTGSLATSGTNTLTDKAKPGDCIVYKITASNTFTSTDLTAVTVSDLTSQWKAQATYTGDTKAVNSQNASTTAGLTGAGTTEAVSTIFATLAGGASENLTFSIKVNP